jgi:enoyl-CoA hydratase/carnithine racemase
MTDPILFDEVDGIATITLNRPTLRNSISDPELIDLLVRTLDRINASGSISVAILTGAGSAFCSGGNVRKMLEMAEGRARSPISTPPFYKFGIQRIPLAFERLDVPIIAAVNGPAMGGGLDLACMCDIRIAAHSARFASSFVKLGLIPGDGGAWFLPRVVGHSKACELALTGETIDAAAALECHLVSRVVPDAELIPTCRDLAQRIAANPRYAVRLTKRAMMEARHVRLDTHLETATLMQSLAQSTPEHRQAVAGLQMNKG